MWCLDRIIGEYIGSFVLALKIIQKIQRLGSTRLREMVITRLSSGFAPWRYMGTIATYLKHVILISYTYILAGAIWIFSILRFSMVRPKKMYRLHEASPRDKECMQNLPPQESLRRNMLNRDGRMLMILWKVSFLPYCTCCPDLLAIVLGVFVVKTCQDYSNVLLKRTPGKTLCFLEGRSPLISCQEYWVYSWLVSKVQYINSC